MWKQLMALRKLLLAKSQKVFKKKKTDSWKNRGQIFENSSSKSVNVTMMKTDKVLVLVKLMSGKSAKCALKNDSVFKSR